MKTTRRRILQTSAASSLAAFGGAGLASSANQGGGARKKRVLAILGDAYHCVAPLDRALLTGLRKDGWESVVIMDYAVPWNDFASYDLIIHSREGREYIQYFRERDVNPSNKGTAFWLTSAQEQKFEDYVKAGGRLFLYHDGFGNMPKGGAVSRVAKAYFIKHPPIVEIRVSPTGKMPEMTDGVTPFTVPDEEYQTEMDESQSTVFAESHSPEHGRTAQGWAHSYGKGKVAVFIPGHNQAVSSHPMVQRTIQNVIAWLIK